MTGFRSEEGEACTLKGRNCVILVEVEGGCRGMSGKVGGGCLMALRTIHVTLKSLSCVLLFVTPWTVAYQAPPSMEFSRQEYWSGLPFPSPGDLPDPRIEPGSPAL